MPIGMNKTPSPKRRSNGGGANAAPSSGNARAPRTPRVNKPAPSKEAEVAEEEYDELDEDLDIEEPIKRGGGNSKKIIIVVGAVVIVLILLFAMFRNSGEKELTEISEDTVGDTIDKVSQMTDDAADKLSEDMLTDEDGNYITDADGNKIVDDSADSDSSSETTKINIGYSTDFDYDKDTLTEIYAGDDTIKDLDGLSIAKVYSVDDIIEVTDYVNYELRRGQIDDGMEIYWMEILYKEKKYRQQISYYTFCCLEEKGICEVNIELLKVSGGGRVITNMEPIIK